MKNEGRSLKQFMLTFDDGPIAEATEKIVKELRCFKVDGEPVKACFFMVGDSDPLYHSNFEFWERKGSVRANADVVRYVAHAGHLLGNHTYRHAWFDWYHDPDLGGSAAERLRKEYGSLKDFARDEIGRCSLEIEKALGKTPPKIFRSPYLRDHPVIRETLEELGFKNIGGELVGDALPSMTLREIQGNALRILENWKRSTPVVFIFHPEPMHDPDRRPLTYDHLGEVIEFLLEYDFDPVHFDPHRVV